MVLGFAEQKEVREGQQSGEEEGSAEGVQVQGGFVEELRQEQLKRGRVAETAGRVPTPARLWRG